MILWRNTINRDPTSIFFEIATRTYTYMNVGSILCRFSKSLTFSNFQIFKFDSIYFIESNRKTKHIVFSHLTNGEQTDFEWFQVLSSEFHPWKSMFIHLHQSKVNRNNWKFSERKKKGKKSFKSKSRTCWHWESLKSKKMKKSTGIQRNQLQSQRQF